MGFRLSKTEIIEMALRKVGAYSVYDDAADPDFVDEAERWLSGILSQFAATKRLVQKTLIDGRTIDLTSGQQEVDLTAGTPDTDEEAPSTNQVPPNGIVDIRSARLIVDGIDQGALTLLRTGEWEGITDKSDTGRPSAGLYVIRGNHRPSLLLFPTPVFTTGTWQIRCVFQEAFSPLVDDPDDEVDIMEGWQRMLVYRLAVDIGSGPIVNRTENELGPWRREYAAALKDLENYANRERMSGPRVIASNPYGYGGARRIGPVDYRRRGE